MPKTRRQRQVEMECAVQQCGQEVEGVAGVRRQERQHQQRFQKEPGAGRNSPQGLRGVTQLVPGVGLDSESSSEEIWEDAKAGEATLGPVLKLKRMYWQEKGVERRNVATQTDSMAIMFAGEVPTGKTEGTEKILVKELKDEVVYSRTPSPPSPLHVEYVPQVEIRIDGRGTRVEDMNRREPVISAAAKELALEAGLAELTHESANRGWGRRVESVLGTLYESSVPSFARFWEQDDPFGIISGGAR